MVRSVRHVIMVRSLTDVIMVGSAILTNMECWWMGGTYDADIGLHDSVTDSITSSCLNLKCVLRIATNDQDVLDKLGITSQSDRKKLQLKAIDVVLFGAPKCVYDVCCCYMCVTLGQLDHYPMTNCIQKCVTTCYCACVGLLSAVERLSTFHNSQYISTIGKSFCSIKSVLCWEVISTMSFSSMSFNRCSISLHFTSFPLQAEVCTVTLK